MKSISIFIFLFSVTAFSSVKVNVSDENNNQTLKNVYDLDMELFIGGQLVSKPRVIVREGHKASIKQDTGDSQSLIQVTSREGEMGGQSGIKMNFDITHTSEDGTKTINAKPVILVTPGNESIILIGDEESYKNVRLKVKAGRRVL